MADNNRSNEPQVFTIPPNFAREGTVFNGTFRTRNLVEAILVCIPLIYLITYIPIGIQYLLILIILGVGPIGALCLFGLNDSPISVFLLDLLKHLLSNKNLKYYSFGIDTNFEDNEYK